MIAIRRILCPVDYSDASRHALDHAIAIARWYEASLTVLHVYWPIPFAMYGPGPVAVPSTVLTSVDRAQMLEDLTTFVDADVLPDLQIRCVVREGSDAMEILEQAATMAADLVVLGTHGRGGFERFVLGSITERSCARRAVRC